MHDSRTPLPADEPCRPRLDQDERRALSLTRQQAELLFILKKNGASITTRREIQEAGIVSTTTAVDTAIYELGKKLPGERDRARDRKWIRNNRALGWTWEGPALLTVAPLSATPSLDLTPRSTQRTVNGKQPLGTKFNEENGEPSITIGAISKSMVRGRDRHELLECRVPRNLPTLRKPWFDEIESACQQKVRILADLDSPPKMNRLGNYQLPVELDSIYLRRLAENQRDFSGWNENIAEFRGLRDSGAVLDYEEYNYVQWKTLRDDARRPLSVYAGAVLVCPENGCIYVHKRSLRVATEPGKLHGFLGGYIVEHNEKADETLLNAALRELQEESGATPSLESARAAIVENVEIGWIDIMFMAGVVSEENARRLRPSKEGEVLPISFSDIEVQLVENGDNWVSNGLAHHLIWLRLGAPGAPNWFRKISEELYERIVKLRG